MDLLDLSQSKCCEMLRHAIGAQVNTKIEANIEELKDQK